MEERMFTALSHVGGKLTPTDQRFYDFLKSFVQQYGHFPRTREMKVHYMKSPVSQTQVQARIDRLKKSGYIYTTPDGEIHFKEDDILKTNLKMSTMVLPLIGLITAGEPIEAIQERKAISVPIDVVVDPANTYVLKVKGESMIDEGILDGDYVVVQRSYYPQNGDVVVALLDNQFATLKKFYREKGRIRLQPANMNMKPIFVKDVIVQGVVRAVIRKFKQAS